jgi:hypothetical protein
MGSGSGGGGGGGSGGSSGGGRSGGGGGSGGGKGGGFGFGGIRFRNGKLSILDAKKTEKEAMVRHVLRKLSTEYIEAHLVTGPARELYRELTLISSDLRVNHSWRGIEDRLGVADASGCLSALAAILLKKHTPPGTEAAVSKVARIALENCLLRAVDEELDVFTRGGSTDILRSLNQPAFERLANNFLGDMLYEVLRAEERELPEAVRTSLREVVQERADAVVASFENQFKDRPLGSIPQISYRHLFDVMAVERDWLVKELRR